MSIANLKYIVAGHRAGAANSATEAIPINNSAEANVGKAKPAAANSTIVNELKAIDATVNETDALEQLDGLNKQYFVTHYGGRVCICLESWDHELDRPILLMLTPDGFRLMLKNRKVSVKDANGNIKIAPLAEYWMSNGARREYPGGIAMMPNMPTPPGVYNLYRGFGLAPASGDAVPALKHIKSVVCGGDPALAGYVIRWCARAVQHPELPAEVALVMKGGRGTGKGTLGRWLLKIFGMHGIQISQSRHFTGNFNAHLRDCLLLFCDEAYYSGDKSSEAVIKALITEHTIAIERKGIDVVSAKNRLKIIMASNSDWVAPAGPDERRFCVVKVSDCRKQDHAYFTALNKHMDSGGLAAFLDYLLKVDISDFNIRAVPSTRALEEQKLMSMPPLATWLYTRLSEGRVTSLGADWEPRQLRDSVTDDYAAFVKAHGLRYEHLDSSSVGRRLREIMPIGEAREPSGNRRRQWVFPSLMDARAAFTKHMGLEYVAWADEANE